MSKKQMPIAMPTGGGLGKKVVGILVFLALAVIIVKHPTEAASWATGLISLAEATVEGIVTFIRQVA